jgi:hypothetical protein
MKTTRLAAAILVTVWAATAVFAQSGTVVYSNDFDLPVGNEWSDNRRAATPVGNDQFLGRFGGEPVALDLVDLPAHCSITVSFELYVIGSWEGSVGVDAGADIFDVNASVPGDCCPVENLLHTTFANCDCKFQAYPDTYPNVHRPGLTGAAAVGTLGYDQDSVYDLSFTFFHDRSDLRLTFAGSPNLERLSDESWGIDNIEVSINDESCCRATRVLPDTFTAGGVVQAAIDVTPNSDDLTYSVDEDPPLTFNVFNINDAGTWDGDRIAWGPFTSEFPRTLAYTVRVPGWVDGPINFDGAIDIDGSSEAICGNTQVIPESMHPADADFDRRLEEAEVTAYSEAWRRGDGWTRSPDGIPGNWVSNAGSLWRAGEAYRYDAQADPPWRAEAGAERIPGGGVTVRNPGSYAAGGSLPVAVMVRPEPGTLAWTLEQTLPAGFAVEGLEASGGVFDAAQRTMIWGPFYDDAPRTIRYALTHVEGAPATVKVHGTATFDGVVTDIEGTRAAIPTSERRRVSN